MMGPRPVESHPCGWVWGGRVHPQGRVALPVHVCPGGTARVRKAPLSVPRPTTVCDTCPMPELPEVETTRRGLAPHLEGRRVAAVTLRRPDLRWPLPPDIAERLDRKSVAEGKSVSVRVDIGGSRILKKKKKRKH